MSPRKTMNGSSATRVASTPVPKITKGKRSARRRINKTVVHNDDLSAMHILANIAGEILEGNALMNENPKPEMIKPEPLDQDSCSEAGLELPSPPIIITKESNSNLPLLVSSGCTEEMPLYRENIARNEENRDCGDNTSGCTQTKAIRANSRVSKKIVSKKVSPGKYRAPNGDDSCSHGENKPAFCESKLFYTRQRTQFKKQKQFEHCSAFNHEVKKEGKKENVKLNIKSVKIPELALEVSETSTVASLKKRVLEAIAAMLGKELDIGVTLQGTKFRDENLNLTQAGINQVEKLNDLDFSLELKSKSSQDNSHVTVEKPISVQLLIPNPNPIKIPNLNPNPLSPSLNCHESEIDSVPSPNSPNESKAIVVHQMHMEMETEGPLAVIPAARKLKRVEPVGQRRIRRPFSVGEVEALVQAVEKLGTGRWRDVKIRAFDDAKHRTYVDLKDKWKTLVHTASIAPQQRRGEPVPQDLLDRVLEAQSYWTQEQAKLLQLKGSETCLLVQN